MKRVPVVIGILDIGGDDFEAVFLRRLRGADCADAFGTGFGDEFCAWPAVLE